jgi:uncharacterized protein (TIGR00369 family)
MDTPSPDIFGGYSQKVTIMSKEAHYRSLENMHRSAACNLEYCKGIKMTVWEAKAEIILPMRPEFFHAAKAVHGFVYFKMLDEAGFFAANSLVEDVFVLTTDFHINLLRPITSGNMRAVGQVVHTSKSAILAEAVLLNDEGKQLARGSGTFVRGSTPLSPEIGYRA